MEQVKCADMKKNIIWNSAGSILYYACQWGITILVVYLASYESAGYLSLAMTTSSSFSAIALFSMRNYQVSDVTNQYSVDEYVGSRILTCFFAVISCAITVFLANSVYQAVCTLAFMFVRIAEAMTDVLHGINQKYDHYDYIGISYILRGMVTVLTFAFGLIIFQDIFLTVFIMAILNMACMLGYDLRKTSRLIGIHPVIISTRILYLLKNCLPIVIYTFLMSLENLIPKNILQELFGTDVLGIYSTLASPTLIVQVFAQMAFIPFLPKLSYIYNQKRYKEFCSRLRMVYIVLLILAMIVWIGASFLGRWALGLILPREILQYYELFMPIVLCTIETSSVWVLAAVVTAIRKNNWLLIGMIGNFLILCGIAKPCIQAYGANGVSIAQIIVYGIYIIFLVLVCELTLAHQKKVDNK